MTTHYAYMTVYSHALIYQPEVRPHRNLAAPQMLLAGYVPVAHL